MAYDFKKEYKEFYLPKKKPQIIEIPSMNFIAVRGHGNPNEEDGEYQTAMSLLYGIAFTLKMSYKSDYKIDGYFQYVVPPLEGFWWMNDSESIDYSRKQDFQWISVIRLPDFIQKKDFDWAVSEASRKKGMDFSKAEFLTYDEGLCVQCMHIGPYDNEPATIRLMDDYAQENGRRLDINEKRFHHEIYLSDARRCAPEKLRTVLRHPVK
ncbi:MAG: GyrI-like domain-containing protein [Eubacteriaceae bacterium]|jgi:hypothetical protein